MPCKPRDTSKGTFYLDNSTLCDAFRVQKHDGGRVDPAYRPLKAWIDRVATEANLCLSTFHLTELARWSDTETADAIASWYDRLPIVWVRSRVDVLDAEDERWVMVAAGLSTSDEHAFSSSLIDAFHDPDDEFIAALGRQAEPVRTLTRLWRRCDNDADVGEFIRSAEKFRADRAWADEQGWTDERKRAESAYNLRCELRRRGMHADRRLTLSGDTTYAVKTCTSGDVQDLLVQLYERDARALPCFRVGQVFNEGVCALVLRKQEQSKALRQALGGGLYDWLHVVGAAYCDVFTCDGEGRSPERWRN